AACCAICFALRPTWCPICNRGSCVCTSIRCRTRGPTAQSLICWNISTRPSSPIPAPICDSSTRSPVSPKRPTWPHIKIPQIRRSDLGGDPAGQGPDGELLLPKHDGQLLDVALGEPERSILELAPIVVVDANQQGDLPRFLGGRHERPTGHRDRQHRGKSRCPC